MDEVSLAKQYLYQQSDKTGINLYDHLTEILDHLLEKRPQNPADVFEAVSTQIKRSKFDLGTYNAPLGFKKVIDDSAFVKEVEKLSSLIQSSFRKGSDEQIEEQPGQIPDILDLHRYFQWAGVALSSQETFHLLLSIRQLVNEKELKSARFWGKIQGLKGNYLVVEGEGTVPPEPEVAFSEKPKENADTLSFLSMPEFQGFPAPKQAPKLTLPKEEEAGCNKYIYFVCSAVGQPWTVLPDVTPEQIVASRSLRKYFTGDLNTPIVSFPEFPGTEINYLRVQIARITASTVVCPAGYYTFDPETADEESEGGNTHIIINTEVEMLPNESMLNLENWVHQTPYILPQGRTVYVRPPLPPKEPSENENKEQEDEDETEDATKGDSEQEVEPETGPPILTPITEDDDFGEFPAWSVRSCSRLQSQKNAAVHLRCNRWPGAHAVYYNGKFASIYFGDGQKDTGGAPFALPKLQALQSEYTAELSEQADPTVEEEKAFENMLKEKEDDAKPDEEVDDDEGGEKE